MKPRGVYLVFAVTFLVLALQCGDLASAQTTCAECLFTEDLYCMDVEKCIEKYYKVNISNWDACQNTTSGQNGTNPVNNTTNVSTMIICRPCPEDRLPCSSFGDKNACSCEPDPPTAKPSDDDDDSWVFATIGAVIAALVVIAVIIAVVVYVKRYRRSGGTGLCVGKTSGSNNIPLDDTVEEGKLEKQSKGPPRPDSSPYSPDPTSKPFHTNEPDLLPEDLPMAPPPPPDQENNYMDMKSPTYDALGTVESPQSYQALSFGQPEEDPVYANSPNTKKAPDVVEPIEESLYGNQAIATAAVSRSASFNAQQHLPSQGDQTLVEEEVYLNESKGSPAKGMTQEPVEEDIYCNDNSANPVEEDVYLNDEPPTIVATQPPIEEEIYQNQ